MSIGDKLPCGCKVGFYWCKKHDIYTKRDPKDPPHKVPSNEEYKAYEEREPEGCSCHISAPCSYCTKETL